MSIFNNGDFYPTPAEVIQRMTDGLQIEGKVILEPSAGSGRIVEYLQANGAKQVIACENDKDLKRIVESKCTLLAEDFLKVTSDQVSHVHAIVMNPPFSNGPEHILHAFKIAPAGCQIRALCNLSNLTNTYTKTREELKQAIDMHGSYQDLGDCFSQAERKTGVMVAFISLDKPGSNYEQEFEGFFLDEDPEEEQASGLIQYNVIREIVNRYVASVKIFDQQLETAVRLSEMTGEFYGGNLGMQVTRNKAPLERNEFKKGMQKAGWSWIFSKLNLTKHTTRGLKEDINKFVETQENIPFTMKNIYRMLEIVIATTGQRMDKAILEVFDKVTKHSADNHHRVEGWKTNSHYLLTKRFIVPGYYKEEMEDMVKALCYITAENYDDHMSLDQRTRYDYAIVTDDGKAVRDKDYSHVKKVYHEYQVKDLGAMEPGCKLIPLKWEFGKWFEWGFFNVRHYKKGTYHFEFKDEKLWAQFNQRVAKIKGYPLPEKREQTKYQDRQNGRKAAQPAYKPTAQKAKVLFTFEV
jgi:hypothetical protein